MMGDLKYFINQFCIFDHQETLTCILAIISAFGVLLMVYLHKKGVEKSKRIVEFND
jgi:Flp pilus assembly protein protease CpaA